MRYNNLLTIFAAVQAIFFINDGFVMAQTIDACQHYQILSDARAVTTLDTKYRTGCEDKSSRYGWYRFMGDAGTRMLDYCPYSRFPTTALYRCGGAKYQGWIQSGSMPSVSDGEVSRTICFSTGRSCQCTTPRAIKIKNCGSFYVHWLDGAPTCMDIYCGVKDETIEVTCSDTAMDIKIDASHYNPDEYSNITLSDRNCTPTSIDSSYIRFSISPPDQCGSIRSDAGEYITYENNVTMKAKQVGHIIAGSDVTLRVTCKYKRASNVSLGGGWMPVTHVQTSEAGLGNFTFYFQMYTNSLYSQAQQSYPVQIKQRDWLYFQVHINSNSDSRLVVLVDQCYTTPTMNPNNQISHTVIKNSCPAVSFAQFLNSNSRKQQRFVVQGFRFANSTSVYIHCLVFVCLKSSTENICTRGCTGNNVNRVSRKKRDVPEGQNTFSTFQKLDIGPLIITKDQTTGSDSPAQNTGVPVTTVALSVGVGLLAIMVVILFLIVRRRRKRPAEQNETMSPEKELGIDNAYDGKVFTLSDEITSYNLEQARTNVSKETAS